MSKVAKKLPNRNKQSQAVIKSPLNKSSKRLSNPSNVQLSPKEEVSNLAQVNFFDIDEHQEGQRIDNFLLTKLKGVPRAHVYKLIRDGEIRLNKKRCKPHERLTAGDVVRVAPVRFVNKQTPVIGKEFANSLLGRIVYEDEGLMVLNKPFGMAVHGGSGESFGVIEALRVASSKPYLELIHRIDKDTSGLLMIAKKRSTLKDLQERLREKKLQKYYLCLVRGHIKPKSQLIDKPLLKYTLENGERRVKVAYTDEAKSSQTKVTVLAHILIEGQPVSVVQCEPKTGRTHQIRVHMASIGHPLLGDDKYHPQDTSKVRRLCLHAWRLEVSGYPPLIAPIPEDIKAYLGDVTLI